MNEDEVKRLINGLLLAAGERAQATRIEDATAFTIDLLPGGGRKVTHFPDGKIVHLNGPIANVMKLRHAWDQTGLQLNLRILEEGTQLHIFPAAAYQMPFRAPEPRWEVRRV